MTESMGPIFNRGVEHLGYSDVAVQHMRLRMLESVRQFMEGADPIGMNPEIDHAQIRSYAMVIPRDEPWQRAADYTWEQMC